MKEERKTYKKAVLLYKYIEEVKYLQYPCGERLVDYYLQQQ